MQKEVTLTEQEHQEITNKVAKIAIDNANRLNMYDTALKYFFSNNDINSLSRIRFRTLFYLWLINK